MKTSNHRIFTQRKIVVIFLLSIFLPSLIVGYPSLNIFFQRHAAVSKPLESNRCISGETAVNSIENSLLSSAPRMPDSHYVAFLKGVKGEAMVPFNDQQWQLWHVAAVGRETQRLGLNVAGHLTGEKQLHPDGN